MGLPPEVVQEGEALIEHNDLPGLRRLVKQHMPGKPEAFIQDLERWTIANPYKAMALWRRVAAAHLSPGKAVVVIGARAAWQLTALLGLLGGLVYLLRTCG